MVLSLQKHLYYTIWRPPWVGFSASFDNKLERRIPFLLLHFSRKAWYGEQPGGEISQEFIGSDTKGADWKGVRWLNSPLFHGVSFVPGCTVTLMLSLSFELHAAPWVLRTKEYDALPEALNGLSIYFPQRAGLSFWFTSSVKKLSVTH